MEWLQTFGLNQKQRQLYVYLLERGSHTASQLAKDLGEQRTNIYLLTDSLVQLGLVEKDESSPIAEFKVTNPEQLQVLMAAKQRSLAASSAQMKQSMPGLLGLYHLRTAETGFAYLEGVKGYFSALDDMTKAGQEVRIFSTEFVNDRPDLWDGLQKALQKRAVRKIKTKMILNPSLKGRISEEDMTRKRVALKFWGSALFESEVAIYGSTVVFTTYDEQLISIVIKNKAIAATFQAIFDTAWNISVEGS